MRNRRRIVAMAMSILLVTLLATYLLLCFLPVSSHEKSDLSAAYKIVYSDMFSSNKGGILTIDEQGSIIHDEPLGDLQNAAEYSYKTVFLLREGVAITLI